MKSADAPYVSGSPTSEEAAREISPTSAASLRAQVLGFLSRTPRGAHDEEMQRAIPMAQNTQRPRRVELERAGLVESSGFQRRTSSGRWAVVWVATSFKAGFVPDLAVDRLLARVAHPDDPQASTPTLAEVNEAVILLRAARSPGALRVAEWLAEAHSNALVTESPQSEPEEPQTTCMSCSMPLEIGDSCVWCGTDR